jgi:hypothetical protein
MPSSPADVAEAVAARHEAGDHTATLNGVVFNLDETGYCARFVRQCFECAEGLEPFSWPYAAPTAVSMERALKNAHTVTVGPARGVVVCFNKGSGANGHIGICLGNGKFAENTSSTSRGPGTVVSNLSSMGGRITGYYSPSRIVAPPDPNAPSSWAEESWTWAKEQGLLDGTNPQGVVTREMLALVFKRFFSHK